MTYLCYLYLEDYLLNINATDLLTITEEIEKELGFLYLIFVADSAVIYSLL